MQLKMYVVEIETALGRKKKGVLARSEGEAVSEVRRLQVTTNKIDIAYCPPGDVADCYLRPRDKPIPPSMPATVQMAFLA